MNTGSKVFLPAVLEPNGVAHENGKKPDRMEIMPWKLGIYGFSVGCNLGQHPCSISFSKPNEPCWGGCSRSGKPQMTQILQSLWNLHV